MAILICIILCDIATLLMLLWSNKPRRTNFQQYIMQLLLIKETSMQVTLAFWPQIPNMSDDDQHVAWYHWYVRQRKFNRLVYKAAYLTEKKNQQFAFLFLPDRSYFSDSSLYIHYRLGEKNQCVPIFFYLHLMTDPKKIGPKYFVNQFINFVWP